MNQNVVGVDAGGAGVGVGGAYKEEKRKGCGGGVEPVGRGRIYPPKDLE